jgi:hypothetical protein
MGTPEGGPLDVRRPTGGDHQVVEIELADGFGRRGDYDLAAGFAAPEADPDHYDRVRRFGRPITAFKRALVWSRRQYNGRQTRFNDHIVLYAGHLEDRVAELEQQVAALEREKGRGDES